MHVYAPLFYHPIVIYTHDLLHGLCLTVAACAREENRAKSAPPISRNNAVISVDLFIMASDCPSLSRLPPNSWSVRRKVMTPSRFNIPA
jgi:hypothetical protein